METFDLNIEMGNDAMQTGEDIADALHQVADQVSQGYTAGIVLDANGNRVGRYARKRAV